jgi:hypothetical protein
MVDDVVSGHMLDSDVQFFSYTRNKDNLIEIEMSGSLCFLSQGLAFLLKISNQHNF